MAIWVQKFGGTSLANIERIHHAADIVVKAKLAGHDLVIIVSAMAGETDRLIQLAKMMQDPPDTREYAALVSTGEQVTMALLSMALQVRGQKALSMTGWQAGIYTSMPHQKARIQYIDPVPIQQALKAGYIVVVAGFQGINEAHHITTLGRGGSDTSAVAIAAALKADECQIFTDVEGIFTSDPRVVKSAKCLKAITYEEMLELSSLGSKVLQIRSVEFAGKYNVPLRVLSSMKGDPGTSITYHKKNSMEAPVVSGIAFSRDEAKMTLSIIKSADAVISNILAAVSTLGVNIDMLVEHKTQDASTLVFAVHQDEYRQTCDHFHTHAQQLGITHIEGTDRLAKLSIVGAGLKSHPEVVALMFQTLTTEKINVMLVSMSEIKLSVLIDTARLDEGVQALHHAFKLDDGGMLPPATSVEAPDYSIIYSEN